MNEILKKIENYNILNYILPGIIFVVGFKYYINVTLIATDNLLISVFLYYFIGLVISRVGSIFVKPLLWKVRILKKKDSSSNTNFYEAEEKDSKIKILFADYNMYRNFIATFILLLVCKLMIGIKLWLKISSTICYTILFFLLIVLFILSYKKQLGYIHNRIDTISNKNKKEKNS